MKRIISVLLSFAIMLTALASLPLQKVKQEALEILMAVAVPWAMLQAMAAGILEMRVCALPLFVPAIMLS